MKAYIPLLAAGFLCLACLPGEAKNVGTFGTVYSIAERDALEEIMERVSRINLESLFGKQKMEEAIRNYRPHLPILPKAEKDDSFPADITWENPYDIPGPGATILYPKGYRFNPAELMILPNILVVIDGADPAQVAWFERSPFANDPRTILLLSGGSWHEIGEKLKRPAFYITADIAGRFKLRHVPSALWQEGIFIRVNEYAGKEDKSEKK